MTLHKVTQIQQSGVCEGDETLSEETLFKYCTNIARFVQFKLLDNKQYSVHFISSMCVCVFVCVLYVSVCACMQIN